jgi:chromosome segregation protein
MFLKSLDIFGFKSFADRTKIEFSEGISALLGPNGCGKSNVVDAIKWVLGEQRSTAMRAERMEDIIFNGTESRKPLNVAEVTLTITNEANLLPIDAPEVQIKRRLFRFGDSEYSINSQNAKLKDVRELFWGTGVGKAAYSVMEQGKIDQVLSSKPDERRYLFEEAAGITKFKIQSREAEQRIARTEENMRQVQGILGEVQRAYDSLKAQSDKTVKYRALKDNAFRLEVNIQLLRLKQFKNDKAERAENLRQRTIDRDALKAELDTINKTLEESMDAVNSMEARLVEYQKEIMKLAVEKNAKEKEVRLYTEQRNESKAKIAQNEAQERQVKIKIEELTEDAEEQDGAVRDLRKETLSIEDNIRSFEENIALVGSQVKDNEQSIRQREIEIRHFGQKIASLEKELEKITDDIVAALDKGLKDAGYSVAGRRASETALVETFERIETAISGKDIFIRDLASIVERGRSTETALSFEEVQRTAAEIVTALSAISANMAKARSFFDSYRQSTPAFLDDFLAPQGIITKKRTLDADIRDTKDSIEQSRECIANLGEENAGLSIKINEYRTALQDLRVSQARMAAQAHAAEEQARLIRRELAGQESRLKTIRDELFLMHKRFNEISESISDTEQELAEIENKGVRLTKELEELEVDLKKRNADVFDAQDIIKKKTADLSRAQSVMEKIHLELAQSETEIKNIAENFRETYSRDISEFEGTMSEITESAPALREKLAEVRNSLKNLGAVNLMAPEEFAETKERFDFLSNQLADLTKARDDLKNIAMEIRTESSKIFLEVYNRIKKNFHNMFRRLFGGGRAELRLVDPNHVLESGIEIFARPPGKKLENIGLLSGGEKSMTAVALLFATYIVKPSPFCLLDEIDAALDEANVSRFVQVLREFGSTSQFIVITHNKKTMVGAGTLLGVSMEESGVTKIISVRLEHRGETVPPPVETFPDEDVEFEDGRELPKDVNDAALVKEDVLRPVRGKAAPM